MRHYEVMLILDPSLEDKDAKAAVDRYLATVTSRGGTVGNIDLKGLGGKNKDDDDVAATAPAKPAAPAPA